MQRIGRVHNAKRAIVASHAEPNHNIAFDIRSLNGGVYSKQEEKNRLLVYASRNKIVSHLNFILPKWC